MSYALIKWSHFEHAYIECIVHMRGCGTCQIYQLHPCCTCSAKLFCRCWSYCVCMDQLKSTHSCLPVRCSRHILMFLYKISWMKVIRHTGKSGRISQIPVRKMAGMSISTAGFVIPFTISIITTQQEGLGISIHCSPFPFIDCLCLN